MVTGNILDPIHDSLDPTVWDDPAGIAPALKPQHKNWIINQVIGVLNDVGYHDVRDWLDLVLTGSLTTYQYSDESDCDISLFVNVQYYPDWSRAELIGIMVDKLDGVKLPGTSHVMQNFVVPPAIKPDDLYKPGLRSGYDLFEDRWLVPPERDRVHNVEQEYNGFYVYAEECADKMENLLHYEPDKAVTYWHQIHGKRQRDHKAGKGDYSESNIVYKFLANRGLFPEISQASGEYIAKTADSTIPWHPGNPLQKWEPGKPGKGMFFGGKPVSWAITDQWNGPHHGDVAYHLDPTERTQPEGYFHIHPSGTVEAEGNGDAEGFAEHDPRLRAGLKIGPDDWHFGAITPFSVNDDAVEAARQHLGLQHPVNVNLVGGAQGRYKGFENNTHNVDLVSWLRPESASKQLWHELAHAKQFEREPDTWQQQLSGYLNAYDEGHESYRNHPWEQEARQIAESHPFPLVQTQPKAENGTQIGQDRAREGVEAYATRTP